MQTPPEGAAPPSGGRRQSPDPCDCINARLRARQDVLDIRDRDNALDDGGGTELENGAPPAIVRRGLDRHEGADHGRVDERRVAEIEDKVLVGCKGPQRAVRDLRRVERVELPTEVKRDDVVGLTADEYRRRVERLGRWV